MDSIKTGYQTGQKLGANFISIFDMFQLQNLRQFIVTHYDGIIMATMALFIIAGVFFLLRSGKNDTITVNRDDDNKNGETKEGLMNKNTALSTIPQPSSALFQDNTQETLSQKLREDAKKQDKLNNGHIHKLKAESESDIEGFALMPKHISSGSYGQHIGTEMRSGDSITGSHQWRWKNPFVYSKKHYVVDYNSLKSNTVLEGMENNEATATNDDNSVPIPSFAGANNDLIKNATENLLQAKENSKYDGDVERKVQTNK